MSFGHDGGALNDEQRAALGEQAKIPRAPHTQPSPAAPPGASGEGLFDAKGRWVPRRLIKDVDLMRDDVVRNAVERAHAASEVLRAFRETVMADIAAFIELSAAEYGVKFGGAKGNVTLTTFDGRYKIVRATADHLIFDERLQIAKHLIDECINEWALGSCDEIRVLVNDAFQVDRTGKVSTERVFNLRKHKIENERWQRAMKAIDDSVQVAATRSYIRFYERIDDTEEYRAIPLDLTGV